MSSIRQILVPVDFSEPSRAALEHAATLAQTFGAALDVLHVWETPSFVPHGSDVVRVGADAMALDELIRRGANDELDRFVDEARKRGVVVRSARAETGVPWHAIVNAAKTGSYDLVVIGTHGRTGMARALLGSVAENVVRHAHCPVLSVRPESTSQ